MTTATRPRRPPMDARIRERRRAVRQAGLRRRRRAVGTVLALALLGAGAVGITRSPLFAITGVRVEGVAADRAAIVKETAKVARGQNLMSANLDEALARTRALPWVADAQIDRVPPSTVVINVTPRRAVAIVAGPAGSWLVDRSGVVIAEALQQPLPRIELESAAAPVPGQPLADPGAHSALELHAQLPADLRRALLVIEAAGSRSVRGQVALDRLREPANYRKGRTTWVRMGTANDVGEQVTVLRAVLGQLRRAGAGIPSEVDVRVPTNPVVLP